VKLEIKGTPNGTKKTTSICDNKNPVWNEAFVFLVPNGLSDREYFLGEFYATSETHAFYRLHTFADLKLMDADVLIDDKIGKYSINLRALNLENGEIRPIQATFGNVRINIFYAKNIK